jgi:hypothetical protein
MCLATLKKYLPKEIEIQEPIETQARLVRIYYEIKFQSSLEKPKKSRMLSVQEKPKKSRIYYAILMEAFIILFGFVKYGVPLTIRIATATIALLNLIPIHFFNRKQKIYQEAEMPELILDKGLLEAFLLVDMMWFFSISYFSIVFKNASILAHCAWQAFSFILIAASIFVSVKHAERSFVNRYANRKGSTKKSHYAALGTSVGLFGYHIAQKIPRTTATMEVLTILCVLLLVLMSVVFTFIWVDNVQFDSVRKIKVRLETEAGEPAIPRK